MSRLSSSRVLVWVGALIALLGFSPLAGAAVVTWDISATPGIQGGSGSWDLSSSFWTTDSGVTNQVWADNDAAVFSIIGTGNVVTVNDVIKASSVQFDAAGYTIAAGTGSFEMTGAASLVVNANATIGAQITGSAGLNISGSQQLDLTAASGNTYTGGTTISGAVVRLGSDTALSTGAVTINGASTLASNSATARTIANNLVLNANLTLGQAAGGTGALTFDGTVDLGGGSRELNTLVTTTLNGVVSNGGIDKAGTGTLILSGTNTYTGATNINAGVLRITSADALGSTSAVTVVSGTRLELAGGITVNRSAVINGNGGNNNGAIQSFSGNNVWSGNITLGSDAARVGAGVAGSTLTVSGVIDSGSNNFGLEVRSAGSSDVVVLSGANTYLGATTSVVGILRLGANDTLPVGTVLRIGNTSNIDAATVDLNGFNQTIGGLASLGSTMTRTLTNTSGTASTLTINSLSDQTYGAAIAGNLSIVKTGSFGQVFTAANTYTGTTTVNAGRLEVASASGLPGYATSGKVAVNSGGTLVVRVGGAGTWTGGEVDALLGVSPFAAGSTLGLNATGTFTYNSNITGPQKLLKLGSSQVTLGGNSTYTGGTSIEAGVLQVTTSTALGSGAVTIDGAGARLLLGNGVNISNNVTANVADAGAGLGVLQGPASGSATFSGTFTANVGSVSGGHIVGGAGLVIAGPLAHAPGAFVQIRDGTIFLANSVGNNTPDLRLMAGSINLAVDNAIDTNAVVTMSHGGGTHATLNLNGYNQTVAGLSLGATDGVATINTGTGTLTLAGNVTSAGGVTHVINGFLSLGGATRTFTVADGAATPDLRINAVISNGLLKKDGPGALDLMAANTYAGGTDLAAGVLRLGDDNALGTGLLTVTGSSTIASSSTANRAINVAMKLSADTTIGQTTGGTGRMFLNGAIDLDSGSPRTVITNVHTVVSGVISNGTLRKDGTSALVLENANTYAGGTQLSAGYLLLGNDNALGTGTLTVDGGGTVLASSSTAAHSLPNAVTLTADPTFGMMYLGTGDLSFAGNVNLGGFYRTVTTLNDVVFGANVSNGDLVKAGGGSLSVLGSATVNSVTVNAGLLSLTGANTISSGTVSVNGGALYADDASALGGATSLTVNSNGALRFGSGANTTLTSLTNLTGYSNAFFGFGLGTNNDKIDLGVNSASLFGALVGGWDTGSMTVGGSYTVLKAGSGLGPGNVSLGALPGGYVYSLSTTGTDVTIGVTSVAAAGPYYWVGDRGDNSWTALGDGTNSNWSTDAAGTVDPQATPGASAYAIFNSTAASPSGFNVTLDGPVSVQGVKFIATTPATGAVTINPGTNNGTLTLGAGGLEALVGAPSPTINAPVVIGADQYWNTVVGVTMNGRLSGSANLTKIGAGTLTIDSAAYTIPADFSGELRVYQGALTARAPAVTAADLYVVNPFGDAVIRLANSTLNIRYDGPNDSTNRDYIFGNQLIVDKPATINMDRVSGTGGTNRNSVFSSLTINNTQLTVTQNNTFRLAISGNINLVGDAVVSSGDLTNMVSGKITDAGLMRTLNKLGGNTMNILGTGNDYGGGTIHTNGTLRIGDGYGTAAVNPTATAGTGPIVVGPGQSLMLYAATNIASGQTIDLVSRNNAFVKLALNGDFLPLSSIRTLTTGRIGLTGTQTGTLDLSRLGDGTWFVGSDTVRGNATLAAGAVLLPGAGNLYRLAGDGATLTVSAPNLMTGTAGLIVGAPLTYGGTRFGASTVTLAQANSYSGPTTVNRGSVLKIQRGGAAGASLGATSLLTVHSTAAVHAETASGTFFDSSGNPLNVDLRGAAVLKFYNNAITTAGADVNRWNDSTPMTWNQLDIEMQSRNVGAADVTTETVGDVTFTGGNIVRLTRGNTNAGNVTRLVVNSLTRQNQGTIEFTRSSALGGVDRFVIATGAPAPYYGMTTPWIVNHTDKTFVTYNAPNGFANVSYTTTDINSAGTGSLVNTGAATLTGNRSMYALKQTGALSGAYDVTINSGGLIADFASTSATNASRLVFRDESSALIEGLIFVDDSDTLIQSGTITAAGLTKFGGGTLRITSGNAATMTAGDVYVNRGALELENAAALGGRPVYVASTTLSLRGTAATTFTSPVILSENHQWSTINVNRSGGSGSNFAMTIPSLTIGLYNDAVGHGLNVGGDNSLDLLVSGATNITGNATLNVNTANTDLFLDGGLNSATPGATIYKTGQALVRVAGSGTTAAGTKIVVDQSALELRYVPTGSAAATPVGAGTNTTIVLNTGELRLRGNNAQITFGGTSATAGGYAVVVNGNATIDVDRYTGSSTGQRIRIGSLTIGSQTLTVNSTNAWYFGVNNAVTMTGDPVFQMNAPTPEFYGAVTGGRLIKQGSASLRMLGAAGTIDYDGGSLINQGWLYGRNGIGTGDLIVNPMGGAGVGRPEVLGANQKIVLRSSNRMLAMVGLNNGDAGTTSVLPSALVPYLDLTRADRAIIGLGGNYTLSVDMNDLFGPALPGVDNWYLGAISWADTYYRADALGAGGGNVYRLGGGGGNMQINRNNATSASGVTGTNGHNLLTGTASVVIGLPAANLRPMAPGTVAIGGTNDYSGGTLVNRGMSLHLASASADLGSGWQSGAGTGVIDLYGTLSLRNSGTIKNGSGGNVNTIITHPGSRIRLDSNDTSIGFGTSVEVADRWGDAAAVHLNGARFDVNGRAVAGTLTEQIGDVTFERGAVLRVDRNEATSRVYLLMNSLTRMGNGTLMLNQGDALIPTQAIPDGYERFIISNPLNYPTVTNGMVAPWIIDQNGANGPRFVTYNSSIVNGQQVGFQQVDFTQSDPNLAGPTDRVGFATATTLNTNVNIWALKIAANFTAGTGDTVTIGSGGFIGSGGTTNVNYVFNDGSSNIEALMMFGGATVFQGTITATQVTKFGWAEMQLDRATPVFTCPLEVNNGAVRVYQLGALTPAAITLNGGYSDNGDDGNGLGIIFAAQINSAEEQVYTHGDVTSWDNNRVVFDMGGSDRTQRAGNFILKATGTAAPSVMEFRNWNDRAMAKLGTITFDADWAVLNVLNNNGRGRSSTLKPDALVGTGKTIEQIGNGLMELSGLSSTLSNSTYTVSQGTLRVKDGASLGTDNTFVIGQGATLEIAAANFATVGTTQLIQKWGSGERWNVEDARGTGNYTLPSGVTLQLNTNVLPTTARTITLDGGSIEAFLYNDSVAQAVFRYMGPNVTVDLASDSFIGQNLYVGIDGVDAGKEGFYPDLQPNAGTINGGILVVQGAITGSGKTLTKIGRDMVILAGANTYGNTVVDQGILRLGATDTLPTTGILTTRFDGWVDMNGLHQTVGNLGTKDGDPSPGGVGLGYSGAILNSAYTDSMLTAGNADNYTYMGDISGNISFTKQGAGELKLGGFTRYNGTTVVNAGILHLANVAPLNLTAAGYTTVADDAGLIVPYGGPERLDDAGVDALRTNGTFGNNIAIGFDVASGYTYTYTTLFPTATGFIKAGPGTIHLPTVASWPKLISLRGGTTSFVTGALGTTEPIDLQGSNTILWSGVNTEDLSARISALPEGNTTTFDVGANNIAFGTALAGGLTSHMAKRGTGTLTLNATATYGGNTTVAQGQLVVAAANAISSTGTLYMGSGTTVGTLTVNEDQTVAGLVSDVNNGSAASVINIAAGKKLTVNGPVTLGVAIDLAHTRLNVAGAGTLEVNNPGGTFAVGVPMGTDLDNQVTFDMSGLATFTTNLGPTGLLKIGDTGDNAAQNRPTNMYLAADSTITAGTVTIGPSPHGATMNLRLGTGTTVINTNTLNLGTGNRDGGAVFFQTATGTLTLRDAAGTGRTNINMGNATTQGTGYVVTNSFDTTGHSADLLIGTLATSPAGRGAAGTMTNTFSFDTGTLDIATINMAIAMGPNTSNSTINLGGGTVLLGAGGTGSVSLATGANGTLNITGGVVTTSVNIGRNAGAGTATLTLDGGTLDMTGKNIGSAANPITTVNLRSGTLANLGELNGGMALTKTTGGTLKLTGAHTYTGGTDVQAGTLLVNGSVASTANVSVQSGATLGGLGSIAGAVSINAGGTLDPGDGTTTGTLAINNTLSFASTAAAVFGIASDTNYDKVGGLTGLTYGGTLTVQAIGSPTWAAGQVYDLFNWASGTPSGTFSTVTLPSLPGGLAWKDYGSGNYFDYATGQIEIISTGPAVRVWNGGSPTNDFWTSGSNWVGGNAPVAGDQVVFAGNVRLTPDNNNIGLVVGGLKFSGASDPEGNAGAFTLGGNALTVAGKIENNSTNAQTINHGITLATALNPADTGVVNVAAGAGTLTIAGNVGGTVGLVKTGTGTAALTATSNSYTGDTYVKAGTLQVDGGVNSNGTWADDTTVGLNAGDGGPSPSLVTLVTEHVRQDTLKINDNGKVVITGTSGPSSTSVVNLLLIGDGSGGFTWSFGGLGGGGAAVPVGGEVGGSASPVPEPSTWALAAMALLAFGYAARRRK